MKTLSNILKLVVTGNVELAICLTNNQDEATNKEIIKEIKDFEKQENKGVSILDIVEDEAKFDKALELSRNSKLFINGVNQ